MNFASRATLLVPLSFLAGCMGVTISDHEFCGSLAAEGAACFHTLTDDERRMTLTEFAAWWDDLSDPKVATSVDTFADLKADIEKLCSMSNQCSYEVQSDVQSLTRKIDGVITQSAKSRPVPPTR